MSRQATDGYEGAGARTTAPRRRWGGAVTCAPACAPPRPASFPPHRSRAWREAPPQGASAAGAAEGDGGRRDGGVTDRLTRPTRWRWPHPCGSG